ncbi:MAG: hypothetical protein RBU23_04935 [Candidatus Auribacterota bacterium]|jgi:hypothetical protein|nr:hypothetical protein [Candidatus Auribacterota bacterium]
MDNLDFDFAKFKKKAEESVPQCGDSLASTEISLLEREDLRDRKQIREQRKKYADKVFNLIKWWLIFIGVVLVIQGTISFWWTREFFSDAVLLAIIGGTTANVLGLFALVLKFLFNPINK